jgi:nucleotide-binding universal stress UspA family protein
MKNILIFIDADEQTEQFVRTAIDILGERDNQFKVIHIAAPNPDFVGYQVGPQYIRDFRAHELRDEHRLIQMVSAKLIEQGLDVEGLLVQGPTAQSILDEVENLKADLIVLGSHKHGFLYQSLFGSITDTILHKIEIPTLVIPIK